MEKALKLISDLIRFRTTSDNPGEIAECADYIESYLKGCKQVIVRRHEHNRKISIVALFEDTKKPQIFFNAHFDVLPASQHLFEAKVEGDRLYGRGSEDCKAQVALLMLLMRYYSTQKGKPSMGIMLTSDEEVHGADGVRHLLNDLGYSCEFAVVADGGDNFDIVTRHKGVLQVKVSALGKTAHSSRYWEGGENAIEKLIAAYSKIQKMFPKLQKADWKTTANLSKISGGSIINQVPDYAELCLDIRYTESDSETKLLKKLGSIPGVRIEKIASAGMLDCDAKNHYVQLLRESAESILKRKIRIHYEHGATDARFFSEKGIPAVLFKPLGFGAHSDSEHVIISSLQPYFDALKHFVESAARKVT